MCARQGLVGRDGDDARVIRIQRGLAERWPINLELGMPLALEAFHEHQVAAADPAQQFGQRRLWFRTEFMHLHPAPCRGNDDFTRTRLAVFIGILAWRVHVEGMVRMLQRGDAQPLLHQEGNELGQERGLARAAPARDTEYAWGLHRRSYIVLPHACQP